MYILSGDEREAECALSSRQGAVAHVASSDWKCSPVASSMFVWTQHYLYLKYNIDHGMIIYNYLFITAMYNVEHIYLFVKWIDFCL